MDSQNQVRVGIVGCGYQGQLMAQAIAKAEGLRLTACADPVQDSAASVAALAGHSDVFASAGELLDRSAVDAVIIATPHHVLQEIALLSLGAGKHVLAEKPIAMNEQEATEIEKAVARTGLRYMSGYSLRFFAAQKQVYDLLTAGVAGELQAVTAGIGVPPLSGWMAEPESGGGALLYLGSHLVDKVLWYVSDDPVEVFADVRLCSDNGTDETAVFQIRFAGGFIAQCIVTQAADAWFDFVSIHGRDGRIGLAASNWLRYEISVSSSVVSAYAQPATICPRLTGDPIMMMLVPELEEFDAAIREQRQPMITATDGRQVLRILDAVVRSGRTHSPIHVG
jgi:predicted dehydrogenase